ncbi:hypothetical protein C2G38_2153910 [Gigaspora rosea]|uniref:Serine-threonine/tyrosine-protein kinase catalytic domain-containing protein n=1 Tax=Gigaspora rosea TaxID=44941 RepID=A0A397W6U5_9GLOM|nr:hypothetical protein C2G38_2153910 [Gigaspora rosea]
MSKKRPSDNTAISTSHSLPYIKVSDIYSFGIIMWEILYRKTISYNQKLDISKLGFLIYYHDLRPAINKEAP